MNELTLAIKQNPGTIEMNFDALEEQLDNRTYLSFGRTDGIAGGKNESGKS